MRLTIYFFFAVMLILYACGMQQNESNEDSRISMVGKWHRWSTDNGYSEFEIDSQYIFVFNEKIGKSKLQYKIENDTFRYVNIEYSAKIIPWGDSMIVLRTGDKVAILHRFDESKQTFESIPDEKDTALFNAYRERFYKRADIEWKKAGFDNEMGLDENKTIQIQQ